MGAGVATMARAKPPAVDESAGLDPGPGPKPTALTIKGSPDWAAWVKRGAKHCRTDTSKLVDDALVAYLKSRGFKEQPPER